MIWLSFDFTEDWQMIADNWCFDARVAELADAQDLKSIIKPSTFFLSLLFLDGKAEIY